MSLNLTEKRDIRRFGLVALIFFGALCALGIWRQKLLLSCFFGFLSLLGAGFVTMPQPMQPVYKTWLKIAHGIGRLVTGLMLTIAYYLVITPFGVAKRVFSQSPLPLKPDKEADSYWVKRTETGQPIERFYKRY